MAGVTQVTAVYTRGPQITVTRSVGKFYYVNLTSATYDVEVNPTRMHV